MGTLRRIAQAHNQTLLSADPSDTIASHSFRVAHIGWIIAQEENLDIGKILQMCVPHDVPEIRTGDHNWVAKRYVKVFDEEIIKNQLGTLPQSGMHDIMREYEDRESPEACAAKDADILDQILLLQEYEWAGNKEASRWLHGDGSSESIKQRLNRLHFQSSKDIAEKIYTTDPSHRWSSLWTSENRQYKKIPRIKSGYFSIG